MPHRMILKIRSSMSAKIALIVTVSLVAITMAFSYHHAVNQRNMLFQHAEEQVLRIGEGIKGPLEIFWQRRDYAGVQNVVVETSRGADVGMVTLFDSMEMVAACSKKQWIGKTIIDAYPAVLTLRDIDAVRKAMSDGYSIYYDEKSDQYCLTMPISSGQGVLGALHIGLDMRSTQAKIRMGLIESLAIAALVAILSGVIIYFLFHYLLTARIKGVSAAAVRFASGDLSVRAGVVGTDEIGNLATSFNLLADEINNWRNNLEEMAANRMNELLVLFDIVNTISQSLELSTVLPSVLDRVTDNLSAAKGAVVLVGRDDRSLVLMAQRGLTEESIGKIVQSGQGCVGDVILRNKAMRISSGGEDGCTVILGLEQDNVLSALVVPISARGVMLGAIAVYCEKQDKFSDEDEALLSTIGNQVSVAVLNARLYEKTLELAQMDGLTNVANRRYLMERLKQEVERSERYHTSLSVIMLDLDKFKSFNDTYGHLKGDELLKVFSLMARETVRSTDIVGRYGGEEFCIILPSTSVKGAVVIAERIRKAMEELKIPLEDGRDPVGRTVSIGVAEFSAGESLEKLLSIADAALYRAKAGGRNRVEA